MKLIPLTQNKLAQVDDDDLELVSQYSWYENEGYAVTYNKGKRIKMHRLIMKARPGQAIDHKDKNKLNNQKPNLRFCTIQQNNKNGVLRKDYTSGYEGVALDPSTGHWRSAVYVDGIALYAGSYKHKRHAALACDLWALDLHGEFASTNFPVVGHSLIEAYLRRDKRECLECTTPKSSGCKSTTNSFPRCSYYRWRCSVFLIPSIQ